MGRASCILGLALGLAFSSACGGARLATGDGDGARNPLACAGQSREDVVPIPALGLLPSGEPVTAGMSITCSADVVRVLDWGPDSSASYAVEGARGMAVWSAFGAPATLDERRLSVLLALEPARPPTRGARNE